MQKIVFSCCREENLGKIILMKDALKYMEDHDIDYRTPGKPGADGGDQIVSFEMRNSKIK